MMCAPADMNIEKDVLEVLNTADNFTVSGGKLMLNGGRRTPLAVFAEMSTNPVLNKYWTLKELNGKPVTMVATQQKELGFILRSNGTITGFAGCNNFFGNYTLTGKNGISVAENLGMTMMACPDIAVDERAFTGLFHNAATYEISGNKLFL